MNSNLLPDRPAELYFEAHITIEPVFDSLRKRAAEIAQKHKFKLADLLMKKREADLENRSKNDTFMTGHGQSLKDIQERMVCFGFGTQGQRFQSMAL